jgi:hypothetical protein
MGRLTGAEADALTERLLERRGPLSSQALRHLTTVAHHRKMGRLSAAHGHLLIAHTIDTGKVACTSDELEALRQTPKTALADAGEALVARLPPTAKPEARKPSRWFGRRQAASGVETARATEVALPSPSPPPASPPAPPEPLEPEFLH